MQGEIIRVECLEDPSDVLTLSVNTLGVCIETESYENSIIIRVSREDARHLLMGLVSLLDDPDTHWGRE